ncbi:cell division protein FtsL [Gracilibacillus halotolerans]|uniref:Cell division protein FtsL n=1 Tax=Gracilibacillus halotolerans TaxID=74386 RepID=A0A841RFV9_9BACI|nr:cell division protein FtsL [Gracilibacillus halotolerans]MBB6511349.1 cell division protein FtsL [Gracilibacillus halotolerans]
MSSQHARNFESYQTPVKEQTRKVVHRKVKVKKAWVTRGEKIMYTLFSAIFISAMCYIVTYSFSLDSMNRSIQTVNTQIDQQMTTNQNLVYKQKELSQPSRIIENAKKHGLKVQNTQVKEASKVTE